MCKKALSIWDNFKKQEHEVKEGIMFTVNRGWFYRFNTKAALHNIKMTGEAAISYVLAAEAFIPVLKRVIEEVDSSK